MKGIVVALEKEAEGFIKTFSVLNQSTELGRKVYFLNVSGIETVLIISGIGKVNAAISTQYLIDKYNVDGIINFGTAGGLGESVETLNIYAVEKCCQYDFDVSAIDENVSLGYIQDYDRIYFDCHIPKSCDLKKIYVATSDHITYTKEQILIVKKLNCHAYDMELGAIAETCAANNVRLVAVKGISDTFESGTNVFYENTLKLSKQFPIVIENILKGFSF